MSWRTASAPSALTELVLDHHSLEWCWMATRIIVQWRMTISSSVDDGDHSNKKKKKGKKLPSSAFCKEFTLFAFDECSRPIPLNAIKNSPMSLLDGSTYLTNTT
jgi:hypothetical protein